MRRPARHFTATGFHILRLLLPILVLSLALSGAPNLTGSALAEGGVSTDVAIVRELTANRTAYGSTYLLENGAYRTVLSQSPVHYQDAAGAWQPIDLTLVRQPDGSYETVAAAVTVSIAPTSDAAAPVRLTSKAGSVSLELLGANSSDANVYADAAIFSGVLPATDVTYEATGDGVKETLVLGSAAAPTAFSFRLSHPDFSLKQDEAGQWGLYRSGAKMPAYEIGALTVYDSSADESGVPAFCDGARMVVTPSPGASTVSYVIPRSWLTDPARVWPVTVDPNLFTRNPTDTYISEGYPGTAYGSSQELLAGDVSGATETCKTLVKFGVNTSIPAGAHIAAATFSIRCFWQPASNNDGVSVGKVENSGSTLWGNASTWSTTTLNVSHISSKDVEAQQWLEVTCPGVVQYWVDNDANHNKGFCVYEAYSSSGYAKKFRSGEYSDATYRPKLSVDWEEPTMTSDSNAASYVVGDTVNVTVTASSLATPSQITEIQMGVNRTASDTAKRRGVLAWFASPPTGDAHWVYKAASANGGYFAYYDSTDYGIDHIDPLLDSCTINAAHTVATFALKAGASWAEPADPDPSQMDTYLGMSAGARSWSSGWKAQTAETFSVNQAAGIPAPLACLTSSTTATSSWFVGTGMNDGTTAGRGTVTLSWPAVPLADSYTVKLWDGVKYDTVATTSNISWTTPSNLFPTDTAIASTIPQGYTGNPFTSYGSRDLRDNPNALYQKMAGSSAKDTDYRFLVVPHNNACGDASESLCAPLRLTLDNRSVVATGDASKEDPRHVAYDFGEWDGHSVGALLDSGALTAATTDLAVASWGPSAALSRTYSSAQTAAGLFAPGWFFAFEQNLAITPTLITYTDAERLPHVFAGSGSTWTAPNGFLAGLAPNGGNWTLTFFDQSYLTFDSAGKLLSETDAHGNTTAYAWTAGKVTQITAANGQAIGLTYSGTKLSSASYTTSAGTRTVTYATASPWRATLHPSTACQRQVTYGYDGTPRLTTLTQQDWPTTGQSAVESIIYTSGKVTELRHADYHATNKPDAKATVTYDSATQATVKHYGTVGGSPGAVMDQEVYVWSAATAGVPNQLASRTTGSGGLASTETYNYAFDRQTATTTASDGGQSNGTINTAHDLTSSTTTTSSLEADNATTASVYDSLHRTTTETSYQSPTVYATTTSTYSGADLTAVQTTDQAGDLLSASSFTYDSQGRTTQEKHLVSGTVQSGTWTQLDTSNFAACGEAQTTIARGVKLSLTANPQDLTKTSSYDAFGNLLTETDWSNARVTATNTYDIAGNILTSTDASSVVSHTNYDCIGNATESWRTAPGTNMKADWSATSFDALGRALAVTTKLSDANGNPTTQSVTTTSYDGSGNELTADDNTAGGQTAKTTYDASANATETWSEGVSNYTDAGRSTRSVYDAEGNVTYESDVGNPTTPAPGATCAATVYDDAGNALSEAQPDGTKTLHAYDGQSNETASEGEATSSSDFLPWDEGSAYNASGQATSQTDAQHSHEGLTTSTTVDKLGRNTAEQAVRDGFSGPETTTAYNDLGWVLESVDANGVTTSKTYDTHGVVVSETIGSRTTTSAYNATTGRLETVTDADGTVLTNSYDAFGRVKRELHQASGGVTLKDLGGTNGTTLDSLGRPTSQTEAVAAITHTWSYPLNSATGVQETLAYDATPLTSLAIARNGRGMEYQRTATIAAGTTVTRSVTDPSGRDTADRWTCATIQQTGRTAKTMSRSFDSAGRLATHSGLGYSAAGSYTFDANSGRKTAESLPLALGGTISDSFSYYAGGRLAEATTNSVEESFSFDEAGNLTKDTVADVGKTSFAYDTQNRLTQGSYLLDLDGATPTTTYYGWDATNAWRSCQGPNANPTQTNEPIDFNYNALGRMASYANSDTSTSATYSYDASGQRTKSVVTVGSTTTTTTFAYDGLALLKLSATQGSTTWRIDYLYDEQGVPYGGVYRSPSSSTSPTYFTLVTTDRGDVVELCDADGNAFAAYRYDAWGLPQGSGSYATGIWTQSTALVTSTLAGQIATRQILRYAGYAYDSESNLYYCSARYYDPATRQWTTGDPGKADGEESAYQYCGGEPIASVDASGLATRSLTWPTYSDNRLSSNYLKYVLKTDAGWIKKYRAEHGYVPAWSKGNELSKAEGDWDFKLLNTNTKVYFYTPIKKKTYGTDITYSDYRYQWHGRLIRHWTSEHRECGYGNRWITDEDFGNIHFGYIVAALGKGFWLARQISWSDAYQNNQLNCARERRNETHDQAMIKWGHELYAQWGARSNPGQRFSRR